MLLKFIIQFVCAAFVLLLASHDTTAQTSRIKFKPGSDRATVAGTLGAKIERTFVVRAKAGQQVSIDVKAANGKIIVFAANDDQGEFGSGYSQMLEADGDFSSTLR